jgi:2-C-methyl-D-erythritol 4-phosphate cytidylyltransferase
MTAAAIVVAAGSGQRFGNAGKSFAQCGGVPMAWWSLVAATAATTVDEIVLVCGEHSRADASSLLERFDGNKPVMLALGGARRQDSALAGIAATSGTVDVVAIHDAARPLVTGELFDRAIDAAYADGAAIVGVPVSDTIKRVRSGLVQETVPRDEIVSVQTPQAFQKSLLLKAFASATASGLDVTDEAALVEAFGHPVRVVPGSSDNLKVTYPADLVLVEALLKARAT